jgi:hypothetical protein
MFQIKQATAEKSAAIIHRFALGALCAESLENS